jgi:hypothetical protein
MYSAFRRSGRQRIANPYYANGIDELKRVCNYIIIEHEQKNSKTINKWGFIKF